MITTSAMETVWQLERDRHVYFWQLYRWTYHNEQYNSSKSDYV